jgi:hypothetical protein
MYPTPGMQDGTVMVRESWLWAVSQPVSSRLAARVGTGVQPLQGENYTYSRVLGHVQLLIRPHFHRVVNPSILPPSSPLPPVESDEVQGEGVSCTDLGWVRDMIMDIYVYACIRNPSLSFGYFLYLCIHLKLAYGW